MSKSLSSRKLVVGALSALQLTLAASLAITPIAGAQEEKAAHPHIDLAFCIDTTGSMQNEINNVKTKTKEIVAKLAGGKPAPVIRVGLVAFRDRGDQYVTKVFPFTEDIDKMVKDISALQADGGGDTPESVNEALHVSVNDLKWSDDKKTLKLLFLIGDAGPHEYANDYNWKDESKKAIGKGIQINTIGCQGLESSGGGSVDVFKQIASLSDGKYEPLSYRHEVAQADGTRATVVSSGGAVYKLESARADWKEGASVLAAKGKASRLDKDAESRLVATDARVRVGRSAASGYLMKAAAVDGIMPAAAPMAGAYAGGGGASLSARDENNLADLVLNATREAAKKRLNVEFK